MSERFCNLAVSLLLVPFFGGGLTFNSQIIDISSLFLPGSFKHLSRFGSGKATLSFYVRQKSTTAITCKLANPQWRSTRSAVRVNQSAPATTTTEDFIIFFCLPLFLAAYYVKALIFQRLFIQGQLCRRKKEAALAKGYGIYWQSPAFNFVVEKGWRLIVRCLKGCS